MKSIKRAITNTVIFLAAITLAGCSPESTDQAPAATTVVETPEVIEDVPDLSGTSWQLVSIMGMDDSPAEPGDRSLYTLKFGPEGQLDMLADCNRGTGSWSSVASGQLQFGPIAATQALCPADSLSESYLVQFERVHSYVVKDGNLFLATMADGSIMELEPLVALPLAATVLGEEIHAADADEMQQAIITRLFDRYAVAQGIEALDTEIDSFVRNLKRGMAADPNLSPEDGLTPEEVESVESMRRDMAHSVIRQWKLNQALYGQYGGRIIYQQFGPEPLDAYREFFEARQQAGDFTIHDPAFAETFWRYFTDDSMHSFMAPGSNDESRAFETPPWEQLGT